MHIDDRLATVLRQSASGKRAARTQYRQLLDLLGARQAFADRDMQDSAWTRLNTLTQEIPPAERAAIVSERGWRLRNPELAYHLANDEPAVAAASLARVELSEDDWSALIPRLPVRARGFLRLRNDLPDRANRLLERLGVHDRGLPGPRDAAASPAASNDDTPDTSVLELGVEDSLESTPDLGAPVAPETELAEEKQANGLGGEDIAIGELVKRIEEFRQARSERSAGDPQLPLGEDQEIEHNHIAAFAFTSDAAGRIDWADQGVASMVCGLQLPSALPPLSGITSAMASHQPIRGRTAELSGAAAVEGEWLIDAAPQFDSANGGFAGYAGMFRRPAAAAADTGQTESEADRIRQILHELRTPVNAVQGFSEIIQQQIHGPVPHEYRAHAATIASDAARILASFDEIDRLVKLENNALQVEQGEADLVAILKRTLDQIQPVLTPRMAGIEADLPDANCETGLAKAELEALVWRLIASLAGNVGAGEQLALSLSAEGSNLQLTCEIPALLAAQDDIFEASVRQSGSAISTGAFGAGFSLRLARAEARSAGGSLERVDDSVMMTLPRLTDQEPVRSHVN